MYPVIHKNAWRYGYWLPVQSFCTLEDALNYAKQEKDCKVYDYNLEKYYYF